MCSNSCLFQSDSSDSSTSSCPLFLSSESLSCVKTDSIKHQEMKDITKCLIKDLTRKLNSQNQATQNYRLLKAIIDLQAYVVLYCIFAFVNYMTTHDNTILRLGRWWLCYCGMRNEKLFIKINWTDLSYLYVFEHNLLCEATVTCIVIRNHNML